MVKKIKADTSADLSCNYDGTLLDENYNMAQVLSLEQQLQIEPSDQIMDTLTFEDLKTAAEMFIYLNMCPDTIKPWIKFYDDLFETQSADRIILTLNRMMKAEKTSQDNYGKLRAEKLLQRTKSLLSLKFEDIQSLVDKKYIRNGSVKDGAVIPDGTN